MSEKDQREAKEITQALYPIGERLISEKWASRAYLDEDRVEITLSSLGEGKLREIWESLLPIMPAIKSARDADAFLFWLRVEANRRNWPTELD